MAQSKLLGREREILEQAKTYYGKTWRDYIYQGWMTGNYNGVGSISADLQTIRNDPNRTWNILTVKL